MKKAYAVVLAFSALGCAGGGQWGQSRHYDALSEEETATAGAVEYDPVMVNRAPEKWQGKSLMLFGVVLAREAGPKGSVDLSLSLRSLEPRNLCETTDDDSCRVTVSEREHGRVHAQVKLRAEDDFGELSVGGQSLVRVVGKLTQERDANDGNLIIHANYYRHWPRNYFVTSRARSYMRQ